MKKANGATNGSAETRNGSNHGSNHGGGKSWDPKFEVTQFPARARGYDSDECEENFSHSRHCGEYEPAQPPGTRKPATSRYVSEFHPLSYLYTVVRGNPQDDLDREGKPRLPTAVPGVFNRRLGRELRAKIHKLNREIDDIQKRIDGMHETVNAINRERCQADISQKVRNYGNEIYLLVRNVGMWTRRMKTKAQSIERIEWSICILEALQEIDETCNATMFWAYATWRKMQHQIGPKGSNPDWDTNLGKNDAKYDKFHTHEHPLIARVFRAYEAAYRRNMEISKLIKDDLIRSGSDEKLSKFLDDNYTRCKGCRALFCKRYDDLFGTRIHCPSKKKSIENLMTKGTTGEEDGSNLIVCFFCTDCFDIFNPSIIKKMKRDQEAETAKLHRDHELQVQKDLQVLLQKEDEEHHKNNAAASTTKSSKKRKKKKRKKNKKSGGGASASTTSAAAAAADDKAKDIAAEEQQQSDMEQEIVDPVDLTMSASYDESEKSVIDLDDKDNHGSTSTAGNGADGIDTIDGDDSSMNDVWVDFLLKTGSIIELNAFMDKTIGIEKD